MGSDSAQDGSLRLLEISESFIYARALHLAAELKIADLLADGPRPTAELAEASSTRPAALYRLLRALAGRGVFTEVESGRFGLTPVGECLRSDHPRSVRATVAQAGRLTATTFQHAEEVLRTGEGAFTTAFGQPVWDYLQEHPDEGADFDTAMHEHSRIERDAIVAAYDFSGTARLVDIGGGDGTLLATVLEAHPETAGVLFDLPHVVERNRIGDAGLTDRCEIVGGDLFGELPAGGDRYMMKSVLHGWTDREVVAILTGCRRAMKPDGTLLLIERVIPVGDTPHSSKAFDLAMLVMAGGQERTEDEYTALLTEAGFRVQRVIGTDSSLSIVEAVPTGAAL
ncbi:acetylserotonin O-methyltransferase [Streptomyces caniferus]|uniref:methyltransferase n=1 Tax=Streptomyces caniferus TaxID=285557 RepID=UPI002E27FDA6|nr:methyltransferase [Streptomyces caniferus]